MRSLEEKIAAAKKENIILFTCIGVVVEFFAGQVYRSIRDIQLNNGELNVDSILNNMNKLIHEKPLFIPTKEYLPLFCIIAFIFLVICTQKNDEVKKRMPGIEHGSARWATEKEKHIFEDKKDKDNNSILSNEVKVSLNNRVSKRNANTLCTGGSGAGKTYNYVLANLLTLSSSFLINDVKGELLINTGKFFLDNGYTLKVLNIKDRGNSMRYNPFAYVENEDDILDFIEMFLKNTNGADEAQKGGDPFWDKAEKALDTALIAFIKEELVEEDQNLYNMLELMRWCKVSEENENAKSRLDFLFDEIEARVKENGEDEPLSLRQYKIFKQASGKTAKSILITSMSRLAFLDLSNSRKVFMGKDEMDFENIAQKKTVLYIVNSDTSTTYNFILGMAYSQCINIICRRVDEGKRNKYHLQMIMDEFANGAVIPNFPNILSVVRSRNISCKIIIQSIAQLKKMYPKGDEWESIVDNCDLKLFLGAGYSSCKWLSEQLGKTTIDTKQVNKSRNGKSTSSSDSNQIIGRNLMDTNEIMTMDNNDCIVLIRGVNPMYTTKYNTAKNERFKYIGDVDDPNNPNNYYFNVDEFHKEQEKIINNSVADQIDEAV